MVLASTSVPEVEGAPRAYIPMMILASPGISLRTAGGSQPGSFLNYCFCCGSEACEVLCVPFMSGISISYSPLGLLKVSFTGLHNQICWTLSSWCRAPGLESLMGG